MNTDPRKLAEEVEAECLDWAREAGWPDELYIGLVQMGLANTPTETD